MIGRAEIVCLSPIRVKQPDLPIRPTGPLTFGNHFLALPIAGSPEAGAMHRPSVVICGPLFTTSQPQVLRSCGWEVALPEGGGPGSYQLNRTANWIWRGSWADLMVPKSPAGATPLSLAELIGL